MRIAVVVFPGTNCECDIIDVYSRILGEEVYQVWHRDRDLGRPDAVILPGGFSYGDYLRTGALAKISPIMGEVSAYAAQGGPVLGICNGFQILCEAGLLPGVLLTNAKMKFLSRFVHIRVESAATPFTASLPRGAVITCPIAHNEGNFFADDEMLRRIDGEGLVVFRYCDEDGEICHESREINPNGSVASIAGVRNERGNVVGMMPHPERAAENIVGASGGASGLQVFESLRGAALSTNFSLEI